MSLRFLKGSEFGLKYEAYVRKNGSKKLVFVYYFEYDTIFMITGSEGD